MRLSELAIAAGGRVEGGDTEVSGLAADSRQTGSGDLFVAIPGLTQNGEDFIPRAIENGAVAICASKPVPGTPTIVVDNPRRALAFLAAAFHGHPAQRIRLFGITGSLGKTSTALLLEQALSADGRSTGVIGSLGVRFAGEVIHTRMTTPEAPAIHAALAQMRRDGADSVVLEVTSHSLRLERVAGIRLGVGVLTNLVPDEHLEFHSTPEDYLRTKARFLDLLEPDALLIANADDRHVRAVVEPRAATTVLVSNDGAADADVVVRGVSSDSEGSDFVLEFRHGSRALRSVERTLHELPIHLALLGPHLVFNAALACTAAITAGARPDAVAAAMANARPIHRRMQVLQRSDPMIVDDTVGNAVSIHRLFDVVDRLEHRRLLVAYAIRGSRGPVINAGNADAIAERIRRHDASLVVTSSADVAGPRDRVTSEEEAAVLDRLDRAGVEYRFERQLEPAVRGVLEQADAGDLVLLLGAQGMDAAGGIVRDAIGLERRGSHRG